MRLEYSIVLYIAVWESVAGHLCNSVVPLEAGLPVFMKGPSLPLFAPLNQCGLFPFSHREHRHPGTCPPPSPDHSMCCTGLAGGGGRGQGTPQSQVHTHYIQVMFPLLNSDVFVICRIFRTQALSILSKCVNWMWPNEAIIKLSCGDYHHMNYQLLVTYVLNSQWE